MTAAHMTRIVRAMQETIDRETELADNVTRAKQEFSRAEKTFEDAQDLLLATQAAPSNDQALADAGSAYEHAEDSFAHARRLLLSDLGHAELDILSLQGHRRDLANLISDPTTLAQVGDEALEEMLSSRRLRNNLASRLPRATAEGVRPEFRPRRDASLSATTSHATVHGGGSPDPDYVDTEHEDEADGEENIAEDDNVELIPDQKFLRLKENFLPHYPCIIKHPDGHWCEIECPVCHGNSRKLGRPSPPCESCGYIKPKGKFLAGGWKSFVDHVYNSHAEPRIVDARKFIERSLVRNLSDDEVQAIREGRPGAIVPTMRPCSVMATDPASVSKTRKGTRRKAKNMAAAGVEDDGGNEDAAADDT